MSKKHTDVEFSGIHGRFWGWVMAGWPRQIIERFFFGDPTDRILAFLNLQGDERLLDAGAGSGYYSLILARHLPEGLVIAMDLSPTMLNILAKRAQQKKLHHRISIREGDCGDLPLANGEVDSAITVAVWHHVPDAKLAARELFRVLKQGGKVVALDMVTTDGHHLHTHKDDWVFNPDAMTEHLSQAGFESIEVETKGRWIIGYARKPASEQTTGDIT